jgi:hypothetical protein
MLWSANRLETQLSAESNAVDAGGDKKVRLQAQDQNESASVFMRFYGKTKGSGPKLGENC